MVSKLDPREAGVVNLNFRVTRILRKACHMAALEAEVPLNTFLVNLLTANSDIQRELAALKRRSKEKK